jgi:hypothetical protein
MTVIEQWAFKCESVEAGELLIANVEIESPFL